ncbi:ATP-binding protein [Streptacidiphilus carbonis]|uniref:ATP-binding protein n=1 Tax=Streptacidiphilus carbonis TaxID=105422 RepID=UPI0005A6498B|nr:AAA family ATPase [Streptacidiphilus carbonis]
MAEQRHAGGGGVLLERGVELEAARGALDSLAASAVPARPGERLLVYTGAAGLGKTSLLAAVRQEAADRGLLVLAARGGEQEQLSAFHVVRALLKPMLAGLGEQQRRDLLGGWMDIVGPAIGLAQDDEAAASAAPDPQGVRDGLDWVVTNLAVSRGPLVLVVDDAHWADAESLSWLASFATRVDGLPVLLVTAYRPDELPDNPASFRTMAGANGATPLGLTALTPDAVAALVRRMFGSPPVRVEDAFCREVWAVTGGNPFETVELLAKSQERGLAPVEESCPLLRDVAAATKGSGLLARLERLGASSVRLAWAVSVLGIHTPLELAAATAALTPADAAEAADRLREARILTGHQILEFIHPLVATSVYRGIPDDLRTGMHGRAGWIVLGAGKGPITAARHWLEIPPQGDTAVVEQLRAAARAFMQAGAPETAQRCLARALREPPSSAQRAEVLFELGCSTLLYDPAQTVGHLRAALEQPQLPDQLHEGITVRLAQSLAHSNSLLEASRTTAEAAALAESDQTRLRLLVWNFMWCAFDAAEEGSADRSERLADLALLLERGEQTIGTAERYVFGLRAWDAVVRGEPVATAVHYADLAQEEGLSWTDQEWAFEVPTLASLVYMFADLPERAEELFAQGIAEYEEAGWRGAHLAFGHTILGYIRYRTGSLADAELSAREGLAIANRVGGEGVPVHWFAVGTLAAVLMARGKVADARELVERYRFQAPYSAAVVFPDSQTVRGGLLLALGDAEGALAELTAAGERLDHREMSNPGWCGWQRALAQAHAQSGDLGTARALAADQLVRAERFGTDSAVGTALRAVAEFAEDRRAKVELLRRAVDRFEGCVAPYEHSRAVIDLATALREDGREAEAAERFRTALALAEGCGADELAEDARRGLG